MSLVARLSKSIVSNTIKVYQRGPLLNCIRTRTLKYANATKYELDDITLHQEDDPRAVRILEKHGKAWHFLDEGRNNSLAHSISGDFDCFEGISRNFALTFPETEKLGKEDNPLGSIRVLDNGEHFVYYLVIRENWWDRGAYRPMRESLAAMKEHALEHNVKNIVIGRLGSHKDGLDFGEILKDIKKIFYNSGITVTVYSRRT